jgi:hypothetical protein
MAEVVRRVVAVRRAREILEVNDGRRRVVAVAVVEVVVERRDARVDNRDADALAGQSEVLARGRGADRVAGSFERRERQAIEPDFLDARIAGQRIQAGVCDFRDLGVLSELPAGGAVAERLDVRFLSRTRR